jgi:hypothetical protein
VSAARCRALDGADKPGDPPGIVLSGQENRAPLPAPGVGYSMANRPGLVPFWPFLGGRAVCRGREPWRGQVEAAATPRPTYPKTVANELGSAPQAIAKHKLALTKLRANPRGNRTRHAPRSAPDAPLALQRPFHPAQSKSRHLALNQAECPFGPRTYCARFCLRGSSPSAPPPGLWTPSTSCPEYLGALRPPARTAGPGCAVEAGFVARPGKAPPTAPTPTSTAPSGHEAGDAVRKEATDATGRRSRRERSGHVGPRHATATPPRAAGMRAETAAGGMATRR